jgi:hypothetical protein
MRVDPTRISTGISVRRPCDGREAIAHIARTARSLRMRFVAHASLFRIVRGSQARSRAARRHGGGDAEDGVTRRHDAPPLRAPDPARALDLVDAAARRIRTRSRPSPKRSPRRPPTRRRPRVAGAARSACWPDQSQPIEADPASQPPGSRRPLPLSSAQRNDPRSRARASDMRWSVHSRYVRRASGRLGVLRLLAILRRHGLPEVGQVHHALIVGPAVQSPGARLRRRGARVGGA